MVDIRQLELQQEQEEEAQTAERRNKLKDYQAQRTAKGYNTLPDLSIGANTLNQKSDNYLKPSALSSFVQGGMSDPEYAKSNQTEAKIVQEEQVARDKEYVSETERQYKGLTPEAQAKVAEDVTKQGDTLTPHSQRAAVERAYVSSLDTTEPHREIPDDQQTPQQREETLKFRKDQADKRQAIQDQAQRDAERGGVVNQFAQFDASITSGIKTAALNTLEAGANAVVGIGGFLGWDGAKQAQDRITTEANKVRKELQDEVASINADVGMVDQGANMLSRMMAEFFGPTKLFKGAGYVGVGAGETVEKRDELIGKGIDRETATNTGLVEGGTTSLMFAVPISMGVYKPLSEGVRSGATGLAADLLASLSAQGTLLFAQVSGKMATLESGAEARATDKTLPMYEKAYADTKSVLVNKDGSINEHTVGLVGGITTVVNIIANKFIKGSAAATIQAGMSDVDSIENVRKDLATLSTIDEAAYRQAAEDLGYPIRDEEMAKKFTTALETYHTTGVGRIIDGVDVIKAIDDLAKKNIGSQYQIAAKELGLDISDTAAVEKLTTDEINQVINKALQQAMVVRNNATNMSLGYSRAWDTTPLYEVDRQTVATFLKEVPTEEALAKAALKMGYDLSDPVVFASVKADPKLAKEIAKKVRNPYQKAAAATLGFKLTDDLTPEQLDQVIDVVRKADETSMQPSSKIYTPVVLTVADQHVVAANNKILENYLLTGDVGQLRELSLPQIFQDTAAVMDSQLGSGEWFKLYFDIEGLIRLSDNERARAQTKLNKQTKPGVIDPNLNTSPGNLTSVLSTANATNTKNITSVITQYESGIAGYNAYNVPNGVTKGGKLNLSVMTVQQVMDLQANGQLFAVGRYQMIPKTLSEAVRTGKIKTTDTFSPAKQDELFRQYLLRSKRPQIFNFVSGSKGSDIESAALALAQEFEVVGVKGGTKNFKGVEVIEGQNYYSGAKAPISYKEAKRVLEKMKTDYDLAIKTGASKEDAWTAAFNDTPISKDSAATKAAKQEMPEPNPVSRHTVGLDMYPDIGGTIKTKAAQLWENIFSSTKTPSVKPRSTYDDTVDILNVGRQERITAFRDELDNAKAALERGPDVDKKYTFRSYFEGEGGVNSQAAIESAAIAKAYDTVADNVGARARADAIALGMSKSRAAIYERLAIANTKAKQRATQAKVMQDEYIKARSDGLPMEEAANLAIGKTLTRLQSSAKLVLTMDARAAKVAAQSKADADVQDMIAAKRATAAQEVAQATGTTAALTSTPARIGAVVDILTDITYQTKTGEPRMIGYKQVTKDEAVAMIQQKQNNQQLVLQYTETLALCSLSGV